MPASPEFITLCQSQVAILKQGLGAALSIVYLTEGGLEGEEPDFIPVVADPETAMDWRKEQVLQLLSHNLSHNLQDGGGGSNEEVPLTQPAGLLQRATWQPDGSLTLPARALPPANAIAPSLPEAAGIAPVPPELRAEEVARNAGVDPEGALAVLPAQQMVIPLVHEDLVIGLLVTARLDRPWIASEQAQIERVGRALTAACVLDQRAQWAEHELQRRQALEAQQRDAFDTLLHQFRNPLTALRTFGKLLLKRLLPEDTNHPVAEGIVRESDRLQELLRQFEVVLDAGDAHLLPGREAFTWEAQAHAKEAIAPLPLPAASGYLTGGALRLEPLSFETVLEPLLDSAAAIAQDRQLALQVSLPAPLPPVQTDPKALKEVLSNLVDNALKYTPAGGRVQIIGGMQRSEGNDTLQGLAVIDDGPGIPLEDQGHLFERHYRGVQSDGIIPGTGLGLAIAQELIEQMQGQIQAFSPAAKSGLVNPTLTPGTAFVVWLREA